MQEQAAFLVFLHRKLQGMNTVDINEELLRSYDPEVLDLLLQDRTTGSNIFWATNDYQKLGGRYGYSAPILPELITGDNARVIRPRILKARDEQAARAKEMAEVFTPAWVCNAQNNLIDEAWFGRKSVFNTEHDDHTWTTTDSPIEFPEGKTWSDYVMDTRLEITCGEAPYITSRYDVTTGEYIEPKNRIGLLDRKLRVVGENTATPEEWIAAAKDAYKNIYAYEWQGDNLLLAREAMLWTFGEFYYDKFQADPPKDAILEVATIISWNVWQMDGLKCVVPDSCKAKVSDQLDMFGAPPERKPCKACKENTLKGHTGKYCIVKDWYAKGKDGTVGKNVKFVDLITKK